MRSRVYTDRPSYADFDAPHKFEAIKTIIAKRLIQHPKAICSYSGGSDSDILLDLIERTRKMFPQVQPVKYVFFNSYYGIRYSDAYEVYGLKRTGCCGCPISYRAVDDLEIIREYEPNVVKAAWNIFGKSYEYRQKYNAYKADRLRAEKDCANSNVEGQMTMEELIAEGSDEA